MDLVPEAGAVTKLLPAFGGGDCVPMAGSTKEAQPLTHIQSAKRGHASRVSTTSGGVSASVVADKVNRPR
jgi:hypothetical protein